MDDHRGPWVPGTYKGDPGCLAPIAPLIWDGHHRARAAGAAGIKQVPIVLLEKPPEVMGKLWNDAAEAAQRLGLPF
jgi:hypothetical protein